MEFVGQPRLSGACSLLGVPGLSSIDVDDDEGEFVIGIRPKSSPLPRRKSSLTDEESEPGPPLCGSRRVSFADANGLSLVQVKEFDIWDVPNLPEHNASKGKEGDSEDYFLSHLTFCLPLSPEELFAKVRDQKLELETINLLPGTTIVKGLIRVLNISFDKAVYVRTTLDSWNSHFDLLAEYIPGSTEGLMDCFSFKLTLVPPFGEQGARLDFCLRYETPLGTFWANNNNKNYVLFCQQRVKEQKEKPQTEIGKRKSCLRIVSQNFPMVENILPMESTFHGNNKPDLSRDKAESMKAKQIHAGQTGTSEEENQEILTKRRQICSRRSRRKAARMARVKDYFSQKNGAVETEREESPPETKQSYIEENHKDVPSHTEESSKSEAPPCVSETLETCCKPLLDVLQDTPPTHDYSSNSQPEKFESVHLVELATLPGGESATDVPEDSLPSNDDCAPAEWNNIKGSDYKAKDRGQTESMSCDMLAESAEMFISPINNESSVSQPNSFTFGTVVAPLYHQVFSKAGSESQNVGDQELTAQANIKDFPCAEREHTSCTVKTDACSNIDKALGNVTQYHESLNQESVDTSLKSPPVEDQETSLTVTANDLLSHLDTLQEPVQITQLDQRCTNPFEAPKQEEHPNTESILNPDLLNPKIPCGSLDLQREAPEDNLTPDLQSQTIEETPPVQQTELTCTPLASYLAETLAQKGANDVKISLQNSCMSLQPSQGKSQHINDETDQQTSSNDTKEFTLTTAMITSEDNLLLEVLPELTHYSLYNSAMVLETRDSYNSSFDISEEKEVVPPQISVDSQEGTNNVKEENKLETDGPKGPGEKYVSREVTEFMMSDYQVQPNDEDGSIREETKIACQEIEAAIREEDFCYEDPYEVKNWEMMVEEEEKNVLTDDEECEEISLQAGDIEAVEEDQVEPLEDVWTEMAFVNRESKEEGRGKILVMESKTADVVEEKQMTGQGEDTVTVAGRDWEDDEKECVEATNVEKTLREEDLSDKTVIEKEKQKQTEVNIKISDIQIRREMEKHEKKNFKGKEETGLEWEDVVVTKEGNVEEEEVILKLDNGENEVGCSDGSLDSEQNKFQEGLVTGMIEKGNTKLDYADMHTGKYTNEIVTPDLSKVTDENQFTAGDDPESDQASHGSASSESDSDDEVELYMHCLRAVHTGAQAQKDTGFNVGKRPSLNRGKLLSTPMPSITESTDEEQNISCFQENHIDTVTTDVEPIIEDLPAKCEQESSKRSDPWWKETFSCINICKIFLYSISFLIFFVVAYHYDFLACFGLYLISLVCLWYQKERQPLKNKRMV